jgi:hypothetical protein
VNIVPETEDYFDKINGGAMMIFPSYKSFSLWGRVKVSVLSIERRVVERQDHIKNVPLADALPNQCPRILHPAHRHRVYVVTK